MKPQELDQFLEDNGITNQELADMVEVTLGAVYHWLNGTRQVPPLVGKLVTLWKSKPSTLKDWLP